MTEETEKKVDMDSVAKGIISHGQFEDHSVFYCRFLNLKKKKKYHKEKAVNFV